MSVTSVSEFFIKPERVDEFVEFARGTLPDTRGYAGCEGLDTFVDLDDSGHIVFVTTWARRDDHASYLDWRREQGVFDLLADLFAAPPRFQYYDARPDI